MDTNTLQEITNYLIPVIDRFGLLWYLGIFLVSFLETLLVVGLFVPGILFFLAMGFFAAQGSVSFFLLLIIAFSGSFLGDLASYLIGRKYGKPFFHEKHFLFNSKYILRAEKYFHKHGIKSIVISHFIAPLRSIVPFVAGAANIPLGVFAVLDATGSLLLVGVYSGVGFLFGRGFNIVVYWSDKVGISLFLAAVVVFVNFYFFHFIVHRKEAILRFFKSIFSSIRYGLSENEYIKKFNFKYPKTATFIRNRFSAHYYFGFHLTIGFTIIASFLYFFIKILNLVVSAGSITDVDARTIKLVGSFYSPAVSRFMLFITNLGKWQVVLTISLILIILALLKRRRYIVFAVILATAGGEALAFLNKIIIQRERPDALGQLVHEGGYSFPSAHAVIAVTFYGLLGYFFIKKIRHWEGKVIVFLTTMFFIFLMGTSRIYLGVHYPSDVVAGYLLGFAWLATIIPALEIRRKFFPNKWVARDGQEPVVQKRIFLAIATLLITVEIFFIAFFFITSPPINRINNAHPVKILIINDQRLIIKNIFSDNGYPRYAEDIFGQKMAPLSFLVIGKENELKNAFYSAGWFLAEKNNAQNTLKIYYSALINKSYPSAPMTPSFFNGNVHDVGFEKEGEKKTVRERHHIRFWKLPFFSGGKEVFVATASFDKNINYFTHEIDPAIDDERDFIVVDLQKTGLIDDFSPTENPIKFVNSQSGTNFAGSQFFTDGKMYILKLK